MANYYATSRTNYFRVTDEARYKELFSGLSAEDEIYDFTTKDKDGTIWHGFGTYGSIDYYADNEEDADFDAFLSEIQKILPDDDAFMYFESGAEKLRYVTGYAIVVTKKEIFSENIESWAIKKAREVLGNDYCTQVDY